MAKSKKKKKPLPPRVKRMKRPERLASAKKWIPTFLGKNLLRGYCNHYGVDWRCAAIELKLLGCGIDPDHIAARERSEAELVRHRKAKKEERKSAKNQHWHPYTDTYSAYLAGDFEALYDLEMREEYGDNWEQQVINENTTSCDGADDECQQDKKSSQSVAKQTTVEPENSDDWVPF
jgi:hypothetical protein